MDEVIGIQVRAEARVERGTAETCACGGKLEQAASGWSCQDCGREYAAGPSRKEQQR